MHLKSEIPILTHFINILVNGVSSDKAVHTYSSSLSNTMTPILR